MSKQPKKDKFFRDGPHSTTIAAVIPCDCHNVDHMILVHWEIIDEENGLGDYTFHMQMNHYLPWYKRLYQGIRFILGKPATRCHFTDTCVNGHDLAPLVEHWNAMSGKFTMHTEPTDYPDIHPDVEQAMRDNVFDTPRSGPRSGKSNS